MGRYDTISFLSDYGLDDEFVGICKSVLAGLAPQVRVVDITHGIPPHDVRAGSLLLARCVPYLQAGVVIAVVDPGVGSDRRGIAVEVGEGQSVLVGPDNGLLAPAVAVCGGASRVVDLTEQRFHLDTTASTFDGRDVFAPVAAHLCNGVDLEALGPALDPLSLRPGIMPIPRSEGEALIAEVLWVDRFGNAQLNVDPADVASWPDPIRVRMGTNTRMVARAASFAGIGSGDLGLVTDSYGLLSLAVDRGSAAELYELSAGQEVVLSAADDASVPVRIDSPRGARDKG